MSATFSNLDDFRAALAAAPAVDAKAMGEAEERNGQLTKPPGALGELEDMAIWYAGWRGNPRPSIEAPQVIVFAGNHGVTAQGVSAFPAEVTEQMVLNFQHGGAAINQLSKLAGARMDVHALDLDRPTADFTAGPAMSEADLLDALRCGWQSVDQTADLLVVGEMGIANTTSAAALANALYGGGGRDQLNGAEGDDELFGGAGSDTLEGGEGADSLFGGDGVADLASYASVDHDMTFDLRTDFSDGSNITSAEVKEDIIASDVEGFQGSVNFNNTFYLGGPTTFVRGGELTDTFFGGTGTDQILGLGGDDQISGGDALDAIIGGDGNDDLWGGAFGGIGDGTADIFIFDDADGDDVIHDFEAGMDGLFFVGSAIESLADITITATSAGGDAGIDDTLITYEAEGQVSTITILDTDSGSVASGLILF